MLKDNMQRKAILIFNDGGVGNYLPGVEKDREGYLSFLKSPEGGAWDDDEMRIFNNDCTKAILLNYISFWKNLSKDNIGYWLIIFSGHGYATEDGQTVLELSPGNDCSIEDIKIATDGSRRLLIADSCRSVLTEAQDSLKRELKLFSAAQPGDAYAKRCKDLYMRNLEDVFYNTFNATYAAALNQVANDNDAIGGYYSHELLKAAKSIITSIKTSRLYSDHMASIKDVHRIASAEVNKRSGGEQTPVATGLYLDKIPFIVVPKN